MFDSKSILGRDFINISSGINLILLFKELCNENFLRHMSCYIGKSPLWWYLINTAINSS